MNLPDVPLLSMLRERMTWLNQRQDLLSQNVANADTPGYVAKDLKALDFERALRETGSGAGMLVTNSRHISLGTSHAGKFEQHDTPDQEANPNGNAVSLEMEMIKVSDTQAQFQAAANLYAKAMTLMKTAIGH
ncbi:MAG: flagellar basal body rod protein FlgB [Alphaproteobacteria bacterium]|nr:flagellar basal body rod protein FlgB [Alphaproteobacteria bacterium]